MTGERPRPLVAGNWKMNGIRDSIRVLHDIREGYSPELKARVDLLVCPPATLLHPFAEGAKGSGIALGGQDAHAEQSGAYTGNVSAEMLADLGATHVILGHSERRAYHRESDSEVKAKAKAAFRAGVTAIVCVGETREEREGGRALDVVGAQVRGSLPDGVSASNLVIAYEPVWAIGTGLTPTPEDVAEVHALIRRELGSLVGPAAGRVRILYGGSVKPSNARELLSVPNVDGALVGGASLVAKDFLGIAEAYLG
ncbi:MAG TPA: triose-phosphate isomerase [Enterovirga sp.]|nr:triose-phosphate isomerase [Enterovirga sp.]